MGCKILHTWSPWNSIPGKCREQKKCEKCGALKERNLPHLWSEWHYTGESSCRQERSCSRCGETESREAPHEWGGWHYTGDGSCDQVQQCKRCGAVTESRVMHDFSEWKYADEDSCAMVRACRHCGRKNVKTGCHTWSEPVVDKLSCEETRHCLRCGEKQVISNAKHKWKHYPYKKCVETGAAILDSYIKEKEKMLEIAASGGQGVDISYAVSLAELTKMRNTKARHAVCPECSENMMGRVCVVCGRVENLGVTGEEWENLIEDESGE